MTEVQKQEVKIEAIKANLEGNEAIQGRIMEELRETRKKVEFFPTYNKYPHSVIVFSCFT